MRSILPYLLLTFAWLSCDGSKKSAITMEEEQLRRFVVSVSEDMKLIGFSIDVSSIDVIVKDARSMAAMFNTISNDARREVNDYPSGGSMPPLDMKDEQISQNESNVRLAFYDPNSKAIVFKQGSFDQLTRGYLAHELAHVYEDQQWGFQKIWHPYHAHPSRELFNVTQYIIEGHAELVRYAYEQAFTKRMDEKKAISVTLGKIVENDCVPCHSKESSATLPYSFGMRFLVKQYKDGGWAQVENLLLNLPLSTEQVLHENKYESDTPVKLSLPYWPEQAGQSQIILNGSMGEAFLLARLLKMPIDAEQAFLAASGWDGDVAQLYRFTDGREIFIWRIAFDRIEDAQQLDVLIKQTFDGEAVRHGQMIDWIITDNAKLKRSARQFLSEHQGHVVPVLKDQLSTDEQEILLKNDADLLQHPYFSPQIYIGPKL